MGHPGTHEQKPRQHRQEGDRADRRHYPAVRNRTTEGVVHIRTVADADKAFATSGPERRSAGD
ncbi:hypothetical protein BRC94_05535 [Halobacteriales archaeon QS_5_70_17]|nr:MAG: hypothetical protein BRC94_05535 [Halobacteriales archaeon QS_5_70_17]